MWEEDIMDMNPHADRERRQNFQELPAYVAAEFNGMTGIYEQHISTAQALKELQVNLLDLTFNQLKIEVGLEKGLLGEWLDTRETAAVPF